MERTKKEIERHDLRNMLHKAVIAKAVAEHNRQDTRPSEETIASLRKKLEELGDEAHSAPEEGHNK